MSYRQLITILILLNCCSLVSNAQKKNHLPVTQHNTVVSQLLRMNRQTTAQKTTAGIPTQRVIAQSTWDHTLGDYADSVELRYTGMRKSKYDYNNMIYAYNYPYGTTPMFNYAGIHTTPQVQYDTFVHWTINPFTMPAFMLYEGWFANYDTLNNLIGFRQLYVDSVTNDNKAYHNIFTSGDHNIKEGYWFNLNAGTEDSAFIQYFRYDTAGLLTADSVYELHLGVWRIAAKTYYGHDTSGNLTLIDHYANVSDTSFLLPLVQQSKYVNTYDTSNRLVSVYTSLHNGTSLLPYVKDTFDYMGTLTFHTAWRQHQMDGIHGTWWPQYRMTKHVTAGMPDTIYHDGWDSIANAWTPIAMDAVHYNSDDDPDTLDQYLYNWTAYSTTPDYTTVYYYETFMDTTPTLKVTLPQTGKLNIYPNPAHASIHVAPDNMPANQSYALYIINMTGQIVQQVNVTSHAGKDITVAHLPPGIYEVVLKNNTGQVYTGKFVRE